MLTIGAFSKISNVTTKTLRYYDEIGLLKPVYVNAENGYRYYAIEQLETVLLIGKLKWYGFSLDEIAAVLENPGDNAFILTQIRGKEAGLRELAQHYQLLLTMLKKDIANLESGKRMMAYLDEIEVRLVETRPRPILSIRKKMNVRDSQKYIMELMAAVQEKGLTPAAGPMSIFHDEVYDPESYDMENAVPIEEAAESTRILEGGLCVLSVLKGPYAELPAVYTQIREWIEKEGYAAAGPPYEIYETDPRQVPPEENITEVYVPVKKQKK